MDIKPQFITEETGPFGCVYPEDEGYTPEEWSSIPPFPLKREAKGIVPAFDSMFSFCRVAEEMVNSLLVNSDITQLTTLQQDVFLILVHGYKWDGEDCTDMALKRHLGWQFSKWKRLDFQQIWQSFPSKSPEDQQETISFYESIGKEVDSRWLYKCGSAQWGQYGVAGAGRWWVHNPLYKEHG